MEKVTLNATVREDVGKKESKALRKEGLIPGVVYKGGKEALGLKLARRDLEDILHTKAGTNVIITLKIEGGTKPTKDKVVIVKQLQHDPVRNDILHVDFHEISLTETLKVNVPLATKGQAAGVVQDGGTLDHVIWELQIECLPTAIPEKIDIDVAALKIGDVVFVKQIVPPEGVKILTDGELIAITVKAPHVEKPAEEVPGGTGAEPELIRKEPAKEEEEGAAGEAPKAGAKEEKAK